MRRGLCMFVLTLACSPAEDAPKVGAQVEGPPQAAPRQHPCVEVDPDFAAPSPAVERGHELFLGKAGCTSCHNGPKLGDGKVHDVGTGAGVVTPTLLGTRSRETYFHDGRHDLRAAVEYMVRGGEGAARDPAFVARELSADELASLVAFVESLECARKG